MAPLRGAIRHLAAATRWAIIVGAGGLVVGAVARVARWPAELWPLHGAALGLVIGASAVAVDERCAAVVDVAPRPLWWRTAVRAVGPLALVTIWIAAHGAARDGLPDHLDVLVLQGAVAALIGFGLATTARAAGRAEPGTALAATAVPLLAATALARPFEADLPVFPVWPHEDWGRATRLWALAGGAVAIVTARALWRDARHGPPGRRRLRR